jgi:multisite-specific tRNA:(cytosine-C5)-methyltransferase
VSCSFSSPSPSPADHPSPPCSEPKGTVRERASSPVAEQPETKRPRQEEEASAESIAEASLEAAPPAPAPEAEAEKVEGEAEVVAEDDVDAAALPAEIVGANFSRGPGEFKEEPFIYLSPEDEQVKLIM